MSPQAERTRSTPRGEEKWHRGRGTHALTPCHRRPSIRSYFCYFSYRVFYFQTSPSRYPVSPPCVCIPTHFPSSARCTGVQRWPQPEVCWELLVSGLPNRCADRKSLVVAAGQPGKQTHQMSAERCRMRAHTRMRNTHMHTPHTCVPIEALARENVTFYMEGTEEQSLTCLHCDDEATHRRTFLQAHARPPTHTHLCCRWSLDELL